MGGGRRGWAVLLVRTNFWWYKMYNARGWHSKCSVTHTFPASLKALSYRGTTKEAGRTGPEGGTSGVACMYRANEGLHDLGVTKTMYTGGRDE